MESGPVLDVEIATRVMRWPVVTWDAGAEAGWPDTPHVRKPTWTDRLFPNDGSEEWRPSSFMAAAWDVVETMRDRGWTFAIEVHSDIAKGATASFDRAGCIGSGWSGSVPLAICRAALEALDT
jgi:hypothetical protein